MERSGWAESSELDIRNSTPDWPAFLDTQAPEDAPNVLVILYDLGKDVYVDAERKIAAALARDCAAPSALNQFAQPMGSANGKD